MRSARVSHLVADKIRGAVIVIGSRWCRLRPGPARVASGTIAACALALSLGATPAQALFLPLGSFGSQGSGSGEFQTPVGVAVDQASGAVYVADSGNARVQKFSATGAFIAAWGYGVTDGTAVSQVCTTTCQAGDRTRNHTDGPCNKNNEYANRDRLTSAKKDPAKDIPPYFVRAEEVHE